MHRAVGFIVAIGVATGACAADIDPAASVATTVVAISGAAQSGVAGARLASPLLVQVRDQNGVPMTAVPVTFSVSGDATVGHTAVLTDAAGNAGTTLTLGNTAGNGTATATVAGISSPVSFAFVANPGAPSAIVVVGGNSQLGAPGSVLPLPLVVRANDQFGNATPGVLIDWTTTAGTFTSAAQTTTDSTGNASIGLNLPNSASNITVVAFIHGTTVTASFTEIALDPGLVRVFRQKTATN